MDIENNGSDSGLESGKTENLENLSGETGESRRLSAPIPSSIE